MEIETIASLDLDESEGLCAPEFDVILPTKKGPVRVEARTEGWEEARAAFIQANPRPKGPWSRQLVDDPAMLAAFKQPRPFIAREYDHKDARYLRETEEWADNHAYAIMAHCLKLDLTKGGEKVEKLSDRIAALKKLGITSLQARRFEASVANLSSIEEERAVDFFGDASGQDDSPGSEDSPPGASD